MRETLQGAGCWCSHMAYPSSIIPSAELEVLDHELSACTCGLPSQHMQLVFDRSETGFVLVDSLEPHAEYWTSAGESHSRERAFRVKSGRLSAAKSRGRRWLSVHNFARVLKNFTCIYVCSVIYSASCDNHPQPHDAIIRHKLMHRRK